MIIFFVEKALTVKYMKSLPPYMVGSAHASTLVTWSHPGSDLDYYPGQWDIQVSNADLGSARTLSVEHNTYMHHTHMTTCTDVNTCTRVETWSRSNFIC